MIKNIVPFTGGFGMFRLATRLQNPDRGGFQCPYRSEPNGCR